MWCLVVFLVTCGFMLACRGHALGVAAGPCLRGVFLRVVLRAPDGTPAAVGGRWAAVCASLCWLCGWECRLCGSGLCGKGATQTRRMAFTHRRLPPHRMQGKARLKHVCKRAFPCIAFQQMQTLRRHRALQRGQPTSASPSNSTRPSDLPSPSSHSIVPHLTHPLH